MASRSSRNVVPANDSRRRRFAPDMGEEHSPRRLAPVLVGQTIDSLARSLAADPEFREWCADERAAAMGILRARAEGIG